METIKNLRHYRGGCVIFMDYSQFAVTGDYFNLTPHFDDIASVLLRKIKQIKIYDRLFLYGFSFGSRLCFEAGAQLGNRLIDRIDACDPAGKLYGSFQLNFINFLDKVLDLIRTEEQLIQSSLPKMLFVLTQALIKEQTSTIVIKIFVWESVESHNQQRVVGL